MSLFDSSDGAHSDEHSSKATPDGVPANAVGLSDPQYSQGRRRMLDLVNRLHSTGVQIDIDLPVIAVIGSQSAGKSSLIESISGITLPRASGTCTRCPTECRLSHSATPWTCAVSLRFMTDASGQPLAQIRSEPFGPPMADKAAVEERIRRAQRAVLNPGTPPRDFLDGADEDPDERQLTFSKNCVCLEISGSDVADLSFVDLPGLIVSVGATGNQSDIELVRALVESYISKPSCLILLTVTCETDFENQGAHQLAKVHDAAGKRTIGVLTKPDRIPHGEEDDWLGFVRNAREPLANGWFAVKQPDSKTLRAGVSWMEARALEDDFFASKLPWAALEFEYQRRLRTANLTECLSTILSELITKRLPEIQDELQSNLQKTEKALRQLPKPPSTDPVSEIHGLLNAFARDVSRHVQGTADGDGLIQRINKENTKFRAAIRETAPDFRPYKKTLENPPALPTPDFLESEEPGTFEHNENTAIFIEEVTERAERAVTRELPGHYPFIVIKQLINSFTSQWDTPSQNYAAAVHAILTAFMRKVVEQHFGNFSSGGLQQHVMMLLMDHIKRCYETAQGRLTWLLELEDAPFTMNTHYYGSYREKFLAYYRACVEQDASERSKLGAGLLSHSQGAATEDAAFTESVTKVLTGLTEIGLNGVGALDLAKLLPADSMEASLIIMAEVRAYYQVAYKRFSDNVPLAVDREILRGFDEGIGGALFVGLGLGGENGHQKCRELLQEPSTTVARRGELQKKRDRLFNAKQELLEISML